MSLLNGPFILPYPADGMKKHMTDTSFQAMKVTDNVLGSLSSFLSALLYCCRSNVLDCVLYYKEAKTVAVVL